MLHRKQRKGQNGEIWRRRREIEIEKIYIYIFQVTERLNRENGKKYIKLKFREEIIMSDNNVREEYWISYESINEILQAWLLTLRNKKRERE